MFCRLAVAALLACAAVCAPRSALAEEPVRPPPSGDRVAISVLFGLAATLVPLAVGGAILGVATDRSTRHGGIYLLSAGLCAGPIVSHLVAGETARAAIFGIPGVANGLAIYGLVSFRPDIVEESETEPRVAYTVLLTLSVASAAAGLIDSLILTDRTRRRVHLSPALSPTQAGVALGGAF